MSHRTNVRSYTAQNLSDFRTAVSLHSHTSCSKENLEFLPYYFRRIPVVSKLIEAELQRHEKQTGFRADFSKAYWTPPMWPAAVLESERAQIATLGLDPIVSITDHDSIEAGLELKTSQPTANAPISVEWTVPFEKSDVHLGVHHLPVERAPEIMDALATYTRERKASMLPDLLERLDEIPDTLVVLNHPLWDHRRVGLARHTANVLSFLGSYRRWIHALEISGLRTWRENREVLGLADRFSLPAVAGGDRHGCQPNPVLNLTTAATWEEYAGGVRAGTSTEILLMPKYWVAPRARDLEIAADALRHYHKHPYGRRRFIDRVYADIEGCGYHQLAFYWDGGVHLWFRMLINGVVTLGSPRLQPVLDWMMSTPNHSKDDAALAPATDPAWGLSDDRLGTLDAVPVRVAQRSVSPE